MRPAQEGNQPGLSPPRPHMPHLSPRVAPRPPRNRKWLLGANTAYNHQALIDAVHKAEGFYSAHMQTHSTQAKIALHDVCNVVLGHWGDAPPGTEGEALQARLEALRARLAEGAVALTALSSDQLAALLDALHRLAQATLAVRFATRVAVRGGQKDVEAHGAPARFAPGAATTAIATSP
mmetsp:Transcript_16633/g.45271  ORF Transcript_16633/g.45271 Transcript_16633/m.45271 type:complete len:179 (-) Transcript_16633:374-910(-)